jgi:hypothetical protein
MSFSLQSEGGQKNEVEADRRPPSEDESKMSDNASHRSTKKSSINKKVSFGDLYAGAMIDTPLSTTTSSRPKMIRSVSCDPSRVMMATLDKNDEIFV